MYDFNRDAQLQAADNTSCWQKAFLLSMMEITIGQPW
jgi:hypothetical protein